MDLVATIRARACAILAGTAPSAARSSEWDPPRVSVLPATGRSGGDLVIGVGPPGGALRPTAATLTRLADALASMPEVASVESAGVGLIAVTLSMDGLTAALAARLASAGDLGWGTLPPSVCIGLAPARRAARIGLDRARAAVTADALARILACAGHPVLLPLSHVGPEAQAELARLGVASSLAAGLPDGWPTAGAAILVYETGQGIVHLPQIAAAAEPIGVAPCRLHTPGQPTPRRNALLDDALDLADPAALRFAMLARAPRQALDLDPRLAADASHAGPLFDVRYAHARARAVLRRASAAMPDLDLAPAALSRVPLHGLSHAGERALMRVIALYPDRVAAAASLRDPSRLAVFLAELARAVHAQWNASKDQPQLRFVNEEQRDLTKARLGLVTAAAVVLRAGLGVLGVSAPDEMR